MDNGNGRIYSIASKAADAAFTGSKGEVRKALMVHHHGMVLLELVHQTNKYAGYYDVAQSLPLIAEYIHQSNLGTTQRLTVRFYKLECCNRFRD